MHFILDLYLAREDCDARIQLAGAEPTTANHDISVARSGSAGIDGVTAHDQPPSCQLSAK